jgi:hypothetical protein
MSEFSSAASLFLLVGKIISNEKDDDFCRAYESSSSSSTSSSLAIPIPSHSSQSQKHRVFVDIDCQYTLKLLKRLFAQRSSTIEASYNGTPSAAALASLSSPFVLAEYERLPWTEILAQKVRCNAYCIRKGISRKAQLCHYTNKHCKKSAKVLQLESALPMTLIIDTWAAFDDDTATTDSDNKDAEGSFGL